MLAKAPLKLHESLRCFQKESLLYSSEQRRCRKSRPCSVRAGYTRKPTGTPGAYQLIDDVTGEKFFVWGGSDDTPDSPTPSKQALSWNPGTPPSAQQAVKKKSDKDVTGMGGAKPATSVANVRNSTAQKGIFAASFGRLKAQRVRALINKASGKRQENTNDGRAFDGEDMFSDPSDGSDSEVEFVATEHGHEEGFSTADQSQITEDNVLGNEMIPDTDHSYVDPKYDCKQASEGKITKAKAHESDSGVAKPKVGAPRSASSLRGWSNSSLHQRTMVDLAYPTKQWKKTSATAGFFSRMSFKDLGCSEDMIESLRAQLFTRPSHIQAMAYVPVSKGKSCIIADQSGSGKTLAYLAPVIQCLRQEELQGVSKSSPRSPRVVILVPTAELASQVLNNCRSISKFGVPFRSMVATGGFRQKTQVDNLQQDLDVLIATPGRFIFLLQGGLLQLTNLKCAVLDEIDILFGDEGFEQVLQSLISSAPVATQYLFVTATLPVDIYNKLVEVFPDCEVVMGPGMHRTSSGLEELLVDCSGDDGEEKTPDTAFLNKKSALLQIVEETPVLKTIVFCNKIETCRKVENALKRFDRKGLHIRVLPFHAAVAQESRLANMKEFISSQTKDCMFLICTDRASRGIDFTNVDHVVLFDFPRDPSEYVRRVGRTARGAGGKGKAFAFVVGKQVSLARRIMERNLRGHPLHDVPAAYEVMSSAL